MDIADLVAFWVSYWLSFSSSGSQAMCTSEDISARRNAPYTPSANEVGRAEGTLHARHSPICRIHLLAQFLADITAAYGVHKHLCLTLWRAQLKCRPTPTNFVSCSFLNSWSPYLDCVNLVYGFQSCRYCQ